MEKVIKNNGSEGIELLLAQKVRNAKEQLKGQELADALMLLIGDYQNLLEAKRGLSSEVKDLQDDVRNKFNSLSE